MELICPNNIPDEVSLRKKIQELQTYRRLGLTTPADIEKYEVDLAKRVRHFCCQYYPYHLASMRYSHKQNWFLLGITTHLKDSRAEL